MGKNKISSSFDTKRQPRENLEFKGQPGDIVIPVMGTTGVGKSTFINSLLADDQPRLIVGHHMAPGTTKLHAVQISISLNLRTDGKPRRLILIDTPGFNNDFGKSDREIMADISSWLTSSYNENMKPAGAVYLHDISQQSVLGPVIRNLKMIEDLVGSDNIKAVVLGTTKWDLSQDKIACESREHELKTSYWSAMLAAGCPTFQIRDSGKSPRQVLDLILQRVKAREHPSADIQLPTIMLLGTTGVGKSTFVATAGGPDLPCSPQIGHGLGSCTRSVEEFKVEHPSLPGKYVTLVDTPGFNDSETFMDGDQEQLGILITWLQNQRPNSKLAGIIYFHDIDTARVMNGPSSMSVQKVPRPPGVLIVTTKWSARMRDQQEEYEKHLLKMLPEADMMKRFDNSQNSAWEIIDAVCRSSAGAGVLTAEFQRRLENLNGRITTQREKKSRRLFDIFASLLGRFKELFLL